MNIVVVVVAVDVVTVVVWFMSPGWSVIEIVLLLLACEQLVHGGSAMSVVTGIIIAKVVVLGRVVSTVTVLVLVLVLGGPWWSVILGLRLRIGGYGSRRGADPCGGVVVYREEGHSFFRESSSQIIAFALENWALASVARVVGFRSA